MESCIKVIEENSSKEESNQSKGLFHHRGVPGNLEKNSHNPVWLWLFFTPSRIYY
jgi:hypothetical protein